MIQLLRHHEIDPGRWEACLQNAERPLVYAHFWYLEVVAQGQWEALVEVLDGAYVSLFPLPVKTAFGLDFLYQPFFTQQLGLFTTPASQHRDVAEYVARLPALYAQGQYQMPQIPAQPNEGEAAWGHRLRTNYELALDRPYDQLRQGYSLNLRRNLKKNSPLEGLRPGTTIEPLLHLFKATKGRELPELKERHYRLLAQLYRRAQQEGVGQLWEVEQQGELLAAALLLVTGSRTTFLLGASSTQGRKQNAMALLLDQAVQREADSGKTFDFEGSDVPGVAKFYAGFGAKPVPYLSLYFKRHKRTFRQWIFNACTSLVKRLR
ncbi:GNAT family N-acetyltransferase [Rufibacter ruber]|uniref:GNAT family N-acetyltransferase n=1 Tax=Rufibacter ruber TaxID=1783499 RepID=UPI0008343738|nr:GNAT family N-acetyltransferase [Rufibacter ruber]